MDRKGPDLSRADALMHPVRLRIVHTLLLENSMTAAELGRALGDVPQASLYRHLHRLTEAGFVRVVAERPAGGATERVYAVNAGATVLQGDDLASATREDHMRFFAAFCLGLMGDFARYLQRPSVDVDEDGVGYRATSLWLTDEELHRLIADMNRPVLKVLHNGPGPGRRRRLFATVLIPQEDVSADAGPTDADRATHRQMDEEGERR